MTASTYQERLRAFAEGKWLGRLTKAVRDPEDGVCDACGSSLPRILFGLRDTVSGRHYFVGQNCLAWLLEMGLVARTRYRQSAQVAYRREMEMRRNGANPADPESTPSIGAQTDPFDQVSGQPARQRTLIIVESDSHYTALAHIGDGRRRVTGRAREPRRRQQWLRHDGAVVLEPVWRPRRAALAVCVLRAYAKALAAWREGTAANADRRANRVHEEVKR